MPMETAFSIFENRFVHQLYYSRFISIFFFYLVNFYLFSSYISPYYILYIAPKKHNFKNYFNIYYSLVLKLKIQTVTALYLQLLNDCWKAFRGEISTQSNLIFTRKPSSLLMLWTKFDVFLKNNNTGVCDFTVKGNLFGGSLNVYIGKSNNVVAQVYSFTYLHYILNFQDLKKMFRK